MSAALALEGWRLYLASSPAELSIVCSSCNGRHVACSGCGHPSGRHWPEWMPDTHCEVGGCECKGLELSGFCEVCLARLRGGP